MNPLVLFTIIRKEVNSVQKIKLIDMKKLNKTKVLIYQETEVLLQKVRDALDKQEDFYKNAGIEQNKLKEILKRYKMSEKVKQALDAWKEELHADLAQAKAEKKKEIKLADNLLKPKIKRTNSRRKRCTRIF